MGGGGKKCPPLGTHTKRPHRAWKGTPEHPAQQESLAWGFWREEYICSSPWEEAVVETISPLRSTPAVALALPVNPVTSNHPHSPHLSWYAPTGLLRGKWDPGSEAWCTVIMSREPWGSLRRGVGHAQAWSPERCRQICLLLLRAPRVPQ